MSKELDAFYDLVDINYLNERGKKKYRIVEKALKDYEKLKESQCILLSARSSGKSVMSINHYKENKALEIIKRYIQLEDDKVYTIGWEWNLTQEEYDLLKEVLLWAKN